MIYLFIKENSKKNKLINSSKSFNEKVEKNLTLFLKNLIIDVKAND